MRSLTCWEREMKRERARRPAGLSGTREASSHERVYLLQKRLFPPPPSGPVRVRAERPRRREEKRKAKKGARGMPVALGGDEGRDKLRKSAVRGRCPATRRCPNGGTRAGRPAHRAVFLCAGPTRGTETSQYPQEEKVRTIARVAASESAGAQTGVVEASPGL